MDQVARAPAQIWLAASRLPTHLARNEELTPLACLIATAQMPSLPQRFDQVPGWRERSGKRHRPSTSVAITALASLAGVGEGYHVFSRFAQRLTKLQCRALRWWIHRDTGRQHVPCQAVLQRVLSLWIGNPMRFPPPAL